MADFGDTYEYTGRGDSGEETGESSDEGPVIENFVDATLEAYWWSWGEQYCKL